MEECKEVTSLAKYILKTGQEDTALKTRSRQWVRKGAREGFRDGKEEPEGCIWITKGRKEFQFKKCMVNRQQRERVKQNKKHEVILEEPSGEQWWTFTAQTWSNRTKDRLCASKKGDTKLKALSGRWRKQRTRAWAKIFLKVEKI